MEGALFSCYKDIIPEFSRFQDSLRRPLPVHLRINTLKTEHTRVIRSLEKKGLQCRRSLLGHNTLYLVPGLSSPGNLMEYFLGHIHPQALTSCVVSLVLGPGPRTRVLDLCSAPGGKTSHMAEIMENTGLIVANELSRTRHISLGHTLARLGVMNTIITGYQAQEFPLRNRFDYVLADVPCSGEGTYRETNGPKNFREIPQKARLQHIQKRILLRGFDLLKPGGEMLYSTCTYNPEENESVVQFLVERREAMLLPIHPFLPYEPGLTEWKDIRYDKEMERTTRFYPHQCDSVGFFMARIGRPE